jgi:hypothetical protein
MATNRATTSRNRLKPAMTQSEPDKPPEAKATSPAGMPRFEPTDEQRRTVEAMAGYGIPHDDIALVIINPRTSRPIDPTTLRGAFRAELDVGHVKANARIVETLFKEATGGNVTACIWWTKTRMGWKESVEHTGTLSIRHEDALTALE